MNNMIILLISILILIILFLVIVLIIGKRKIEELIIPLDISKQEINTYLKEKYKVYREIVEFLKSNLSIREEAFKNFLDFNAKECLQNDLINILDNTTDEINEYVDNYDDLLKNDDFLKLKKKLYNIQVNLEAVIDYYNGKINIYNNLKEKYPTSLATKFFVFEDYSKVKNEKKEISRLISLN